MSVPPGEVLDLIERYRADAARFRSAAFTETASRRELVDPVVRALGWDPDNAGLAPDACEVVRATSQAAEGAGKAPGYAFRLNRRLVFCLEPRRPGAQISARREPAYQIRRHGWSAGLPLGIVTDFEEWAVYDCRAEPDPGDPPTTARVQCFAYDQLDERWSGLAALFSRDAVLGGSLARHSAEHPAPRRALTVDQALLRDITGWRKALAADIAGHDATLTAAEVSAAVQSLIDRIVFLRVAEARGQEPPGALKACADDDEAGIYERLTGLFRRAAGRYDSGLFSSSSAPSLTIKDLTLRHIIARLYDPSPYDFSVLPADLLGRVYEQFLGAAITLDGTRATVAEKPEVRKAGGVYYTPAPIVDYIVEGTLGPLVEGSTPGEVARIRLVDPACGSGSFLIAAYQYLIDWHTAYYAAGPRDDRALLETTPLGGVRLKTAERKRILLNNIHGVDIDPQAVEVTKLTLLLTVLEGQSRPELEIEHLLPDLDDNIRCGDSLIDADFPHAAELTDSERLKVSPFSWQQSFASVFAAGGFDAVVGNPPYLSIDAVWGPRDPRQAYIRTRYRDIHTDKTDILFYFLAKAVSICKGEIGLIVSRSFLEADKAQKLRGWLASHARVREVVDFREARVFPGAAINTAIIRLSGSNAVRSAAFRRYKARALPPGYLASHLRDSSMFVETAKPLSELGPQRWVATDPEDAAIIAKIDAAGPPIATVLHIGQGMQTGDNAAFTIAADQAPLRAAARQHGLLAKRARNSDIGAFDLAPDGPEILYPEDVSSFASLPAAVREHLTRRRATLERRAAYRRGDCEWWRYTWPLHQAFVREPRILAPYRARENRFAVDRHAEFIGLTDTTVLYAGGQPEDLRYIAAVLNSRALTYRFRFIAKLAGGGTYEYFHNTVGRLPLPRSRPGDPIHDALVRLAADVAQQKTVRRSAPAAEERESAEHRVRAALEQIDDLVSGLFGLTTDERARIDASLAG